MSTVSNSEQVAVSGTWQEGSARVFARRTATLSADLSTVEACALDSILVEVTGPYGKGTEQLAVNFDQIPMLLRAIDGAANMLGIEKR